MLRKLLKKYRKSSTEESLPLELCTSSQLTQQPETLSTQAGCGLQSASNDVVCTGWLEKSPPEKKLDHHAWKKRWFILRSGQMTGDPDVLEYYKNEHSKKPLRVINLNFCSQLGVGVTFNKKELQKSFMFDIKTNERTFYLVSETEADMNRWVQSICQICGFSQTKGNTEVLKNLPSVSHSHRSLPAEFSSSSQHLFPARRSLALSHSSQLPLSSCIQPAMSTSAPQEYQHLHQCISGRTENARNASFSQRNLQESDTEAQNVAQGNRHYINRVSSQDHDFYSIPKPSQYSGSDLPHSLASHSHTKCSLTGCLADSGDVYTFKAPRNTTCREFGDLPVDSAISPPPLHPKTPFGDSSQQRPPVSDYKYPTLGRETAYWCAKSPEKVILGLSDNASCDDNYVSVNPGSDITMSTMPHHIASLGSEIQPPPVYHHLKPALKAKPEPLNLRNNTVINELPFKSPVTKPWSTVNNTFNRSSSQYCRSISITDSGDIEENYVPMQNLTSSSPVPSGTNNPAPKKSTGNVNYRDPDFQQPSPSPQHKPSTSSVTSDEKRVYVQIDEE